MPGVGEQRGQRNHDGVAGGGGALQLEPVDGRDQVFAVHGGQLRHLRRAGEGDDAHLHVARQLADEGLGRVLRGHQPVGLHVGGAHAARHVHGQDDGLLVGRQRDHRHRPRRRQQHRRQASRKSAGGMWRRIGLAGAHRFLDDRQRRIAQRHLLLAPQQPDVQQHQQRQRQQQPEEFGPEEVHGSSPPSSGGALAGAPASRRPTRAARGACAFRRSARPRRPGRRRWTSSSASTPARTKPSRSSASRCAAMRAKRLRKPASWVSTSSCSPVSASRMVSRPRSGRSSSSGSSSAHRDHLVALRQQGQRPFPARLADEVGHDEDGGAALDQAGRPMRAGRAGRSCRDSAGAGRACMLCSRCSTWRRPPRVGITVSTPEP